MSFESQQNLRVIIYHEAEWSHEKILEVKEREIILKDFFLNFYKNGVIFMMVPRVSDLIKIHICQYYK